MKSKVFLGLALLIGVIIIVKTIVIATFTLIGALALVSIVGFYVAKRLDKKYGTEKVGRE